MPPCGPPEKTPTVTFLPFQAGSGLPLSAAAKAASACAFSSVVYGSAVPAAVGAAAGAVVGVAAGATVGAAAGAVVGAAAGAVVGFAAGAGALVGAAGGEDWHAASRPAAAVRPRPSTTCRRVTVRESIESAIKSPLLR